MNISGLLSSAHVPIVRKVKRKTQISITALVLLVILCMFSTGAYALTDYGTFSYWYPDSNKIGFWPSSSLDIFTGNCIDSGWSSSNLTSYCSYGRSAWYSTSGINYTSVYDESSADIKYYGVSQTQATVLGIPTDATAATAVYSTLVGSGYYGYNLKYVYSIDNVLVYFIWDTAY